MKASTAIASAAVLFALAGSASAAISTSRTLGAASPLVTKADFAQGHEAIAGFAARNAEASAVMAQRYFDVDVIITLGALALASGAFVAVGIAGSRRRVTAQPVASPREGWREDVMQALEADLAQFTVSLRKAA